jgi:hypothetical protein
VLVILRLGTANAAPEGAVTDEVTRVHVLVLLVVAVPYEEGVSAAPWLSYQRICALTLRPVEPACV